MKKKNKSLIEGIIKELDYHYFIEKNESIDDFTDQGDVDFSDLEGLVTDPIHLKEKSFVKDIVEADHYDKMSDIKVFESKELWVTK